MTTASDKALEAARRLERERYVGSKFISDARLVAAALLSTEERVSVLQRENDDLKDQMRGVARQLNAMAGSAGDAEEEKADG